MFSPKDDKPSQSELPVAARRWRWFSSSKGYLQQEHPDWVQANPVAIDRALQHALQKPTGNWYVLDARRNIAAKPRAYQVAGCKVVVWRSADGQFHVAPESCPHMGASLAGACVRDGALLCPWHGLALGPEGHGKWKHLDCFDDGVLLWVRIGAADPALPAPVITPRPRAGIDAVIRMEAKCEARDVIANRLDPWHGAHFHPYSFGALKVLEHDDERLLLRVEKLVVGRIRVEVDATFHCPDARTIVMTIVGGEGEGSVVETHATPMSFGLEARTAIVEATIANSSRPGFSIARSLAAMIRPFMRRSARRLWVDDAAYAERLYELRCRSEKRSS